MKKHIALLLTLPLILLGCTQPEKTTPTLEIEAESPTISSDSINIIETFLKDTTDATYANYEANEIESKGDQSIVFSDMKTHNHANLSGLTQLDKISYTHFSFKHKESDVIFTNVLQFVFSANESRSMFEEILIATRSKIESLGFSNVKNIEQYPLFNQIEKDCVLFQANDVAICIVTNPIDSGSSGFYLDTMNISVFSNYMLGFGGMDEQQRILTWLM